MSMYKKKAFPLDAKGIDDAAAYLEDELRQLELPSKDVLRLRLSAEEILIKWMESGLMGSQFDVALTKRMRRITLTICCAGHSLDPVSVPEDENYGSTLLGRSMLENLGLSFSWQYRNGINSVTTSQRTGKKLSQLKQVMIAAALAFVLGIGGTFLPQAWIDTLLNTLIDPFFNGFLRMLSCVVGPMMFLSMIWGIFNIGDTRQLGMIGKTLLIRFLSISTLVGLFCIGVAIFVFNLSIGGGQAGQGVFKSLVEMIIDIIPPNIVDPFSTGNTLQILFMGTVVGISMILLRDRMQTLSVIVEQSNAIVQIILSAIGALVPGFIFLSVLRLILQGTLTQNAAGLLTMILLSVLVTVIEMALEIFSLCRLGMSPAKAFRKVSPVCLVALSTASSAASYPAMLDCCEKKLGIDSKLANFALPFGSVVFMPHAVNLFILVPLFVSKLYGVEMTTSSLIICLLNAVILSVAAPPIPGGALSCYTLMFMQLGIPLEGISLAVAANVVLDFTVTCGNLTDLIIQLAHGAKHMNMLDKDAFHGA